MMIGTFKETNELIVAGEYDVIVVGGGVAGVGAALAARRNGCSVLVIEKSVILGGLATLGLIIFYLPLCDGKGRKVCGGVAEELLHASIKYGYDTLPPEWRNGPKRVKTEKRYVTAFSAPAFTVALDEVVEEAGVEVLYDTLFCRPVMTDGTCEAVVVENKSGRSAYAAKVVIDATGDCDVMARAGAACVEGENWLVHWAIMTDLASMQKAVETGDMHAGLKLLALGGDDVGRGEPKGARRYHGISAREVNEFIHDSRRLLRETVKTWDRGKQVLATVAGMPQFRMTRRIRGVYDLQADDVFKRFDDSVGCTGHHVKRGPVYEIPYRCLLSPGMRNLATAGRTIGSAGDAWQVTRVIPPAVMTGQAAGTAAALAIEQDVDLHAVPVAELQERLAQTGVMVHHQE